MLDTANGHGGADDAPDHAVRFEITCAVILTGDWAGDRAILADSIRQLGRNIADRLATAADDLERDGAVHDPGDTIAIEEDKP